MSSCATHVRRINPVDGTSVVYDAMTGLVVTDAAVLARLACCPEKQVISEKVCMQPTGNTDPNLVEKGKCLQTVAVAADDTTSVLSTVLLQLDGTDVTDTYEVVECPDMTPIEVPLCDPGV